MSRKKKAKTPQEIAADLQNRRRKDFEAVGLCGQASLLPAHADVLVEREVRQSPGQRGNIDRVRRLSGLDWLWNKQRIEPHQMQAALKYGDDYRQANDQRVRSCMAEAMGGDLMYAQEKRMEAGYRLRKAQAEALNGHPSMLNLCNRVAGEGERLTVIAAGNDAEAKKLEAVFCVSLDLLAAHYGMFNA